MSVTSPRRERVGHGRPLRGRDKHDDRRELAEQSALSILTGLPDDGFVVDSDEVRRWVQKVSKPHGRAQLEPPRESWLARLSAAFRRRGVR
jgi:hypothetical protein